MPSAVQVGVGDDAAVVAVSSGRVVVAVDQMIEGRHFRRDWSSANDIGRKAVARSMSDIAAMGATPTALLVALAAPADLPVQWVHDLVIGMVTEAAVVGAALVGGDTSASDVLTLSVTALGSAADRVLTRAGAQVGDGVWVAGDLGRAAAGLAVLSRGHRQPKSLVSAHRVPEPPYAAALAAVAAGATSMIDVSDGLLADAGHLARASGVTIDLVWAALTGDSDLEAMARNLGVDASTWILGGGEDHALLATFPASATVPAAFRRIGVVTSSNVEESDGVLLDGASVSVPIGHEHFR
jgi:thiamine-monophosphate kinase